MCPTSPEPSPNGSAIAYGFLNSCGIDPSGNPVYGKGLISIGSFHLPPCYAAVGGSNSGTRYGGSALGELYRYWLNNGGPNNPQVTLCTQGSGVGAPCKDADGSIWTVTIVDSNGNTGKAQWTWDGGKVTCAGIGVYYPGCLDPSQYTNYLTLDHKCHATGSSYALGEERILLMKRGCPR
jgi:hypothetical protein